MEGFPTSLREEKLKGLRRDLREDWYSTSSEFTRFARGMRLRRDRMEDKKIGRWED